MEAMKLSGVYTITGANLARGVFLCFLLSLFFLFGFIQSAQAAISTGGATCTANDKTASTTLTCTVATESFNAGNYAVMIFGGDNTATVDGNDQLLSSVSDTQGNTWTVERCFTNSQSVAGDGATTCIAKSKITTTLTTSDSITATFASITAKAIVVREYTVDTGNYLRVVGTPQDDARTIDPVNLTISGLESGEYLYLRSVAIERTAPGSWSTTTNFTNTGCSGTTGGLNASNMEVCGEFLIESSSTGTSSNPDTASNLRDNASIFLAFEEYSYSLAGSVYFDAGYTLVTSSRTVKMAIGTSTPSVHSTTTDASGTWEIVPETIGNLAAGVPIVIWIDGDANFKASTFTVLPDGVTSLIGLDLYESYAVIRNDLGVATTTRLAQLGFYDATDDSDIPYTVTGTSTLTVHNGVALYVAEDSIFNPEGEVIVSGDGKASATEGSLYVYGEYTPLSTTTLAGNLYIGEEAIFRPAPAGIVFNATTTHKFLTVHNNAPIGTLIFSGVGGGWVFDTNATTSDITIATGTVTFPRGVLRIEGDLIQNGTLVEQGGVIEIAHFDNEASGDLSSRSLGQLRVVAGDEWSTERSSFGFNGKTAAVIDEVTQVLFVGSSGEGAPPNYAQVYRCVLSSDCDESGDFSVAYTLPDGYEINDMVIDPVNRRLYLVDSVGTLHHCLMVLGCDASGDFSVTFDFGLNPLEFLLVDERHGVLYVGGSGAALYRCDLSTGCNAGGDFTTAFTSGESSLTAGVIDYTRGAMYIGSGTGGIIYRCDLSTSCDASGDFTTAYDTAATEVSALTVDEASRVLYAGTGNSGIIYRCDLSTGCDASGDFTTAYDTAATQIYDIYVDSIKGVLYAGGNSANFYTCALSTSCDASGDFSTVTLGSASGNIRSITGTNNVSALFVAENMLTRFVDTATSSLVIADDALVDSLIIGANASTTLPTLVTVRDDYENYGLAYGAGTTTFTGFAAAATGTLTDVSALGNLTYAGHSAYTSGATTTFTYPGVIIDPSAGLDQIIDMTGDAEALYVTGSCDGCGTSGGYAIYTVAYDKESGAVLWATSTDPSSGEDVGQKIAVDDTMVYVHGYRSSGPLGGEALYLVAYDKITGAQSWATTTDITSGNDRGVGVAVDSEYIYVNGRCDGCGGLGGNAIYNAKLRKSDRSVVWSNIDDVTSSADYGVDIELDGASVYGLGFCTGCGNLALSAYYHYRLDRETGSLVWSTTTDPTNGSDIPLDMEMDGEVVYSTGYCATCGVGTTNAWYTVARNKEDGSLVWATSTSFDSSATDRAYGIAVDGNSVYVAGRFDTVVDSVEQFTVVSYDKNTGLENTSRILPSNSSSTRARGVMVDGVYVYVSGYCTGCGTSGGETYYLTKFTKDTLTQVDGDNTFTFGANASTSDLTIEAAPADAANTVIAPTALTIAGDYTNNDTFTAASGTVYFASLPEQILRGNLNNNAANTSAFHNLVLSGDGAKKPLAPLQVTGDFLIATGTEFLASSTLTVGGNFTNSGTYSISASTGWSNYGATTTNLWRSVTYGNGLFVAVGCENGGEGCDSVATDNVMTSSDGETWIMRTGISSPVQWRSVTYGDGLFVAVGCATANCASVSGATTTNIMTSPDGVTWSPQVSPFEIDLFDVTYGDGLYVAVGCTQTFIDSVYCWDGGSIFISTNGIDWSEQIDTPDMLPLSVTYGNGTFVAVGCANGVEVNMCGATTTAVLASNDGLSWSTSTLPTAVRLGAISYGSGEFVAMCGNGVFGFDSCDSVFYSPDGISWSSAELPVNVRVGDITYGNGLFVASNLGSNNSFLTSIDLVNWIETIYDTYFGAWYGLAFNEKFVAVGEAEDGFNHGDVIASLGQQRPLIFNGSGTTSVQYVSGNLTGVTGLPELIFSNASPKLISSSASATKVTIDAASGPVTLGSDFNVTGDLVNNATLQASGTVYLSAAGTNSGQAEVSGNFSSNSYFTNLEAIDGVVEFKSDATTTDFTVRSGAEVRMPGNLYLEGDLTQNGTTTNFAWDWEVVSVPGVVNEGRLVAITYANGQFLAIGSGLVAYSSDAVNWSTSSHAFSSDQWDLIYAEGVYVAVGDTLIITSDDGLAWTQRSSIFAGGKIAYGNGVFVVVSDNPAYPVRTSPDGVTWTVQSIGFEYLYDVTYGEDLFVAVGYGGTILTSTDGVVWTERNSSVAYDLDTALYGNGIFIVSGSGSALYSEDGSLWTSAGAGDFTPDAAYFGGGQFLGFGDSTYDGIMWHSNYIGYPVDAEWSGFAYGDGKFVRTCLYDYVTFQDCDFVIVANQPTLHLVGTTTQTISGSLTGVQSLASVQIENDSAPIVFADDVAIMGNVVAALPNTELEFLAGSANTFGSTTIAGTSGNEILLRSSASGTRFSLDIVDEYDITYADIKDSNGSAGDGPIDVSDGTSVDSGNNSGWQFIFNPSDYLTVSGVVYAHDTTTPLTGGKKVTLALVATSTMVTYSTYSESSSGAFDFNIYLGDVVATATPLSVYIDDDVALRAVTVSKTSGTTTLTGVDLYEDRVSASHDGLVPIEIADFAHYDYDDDSDIPYTANSGVLQIKRGADLYIAPGKTFSPQGTVLASSTITIGSGAEYDAPSSTTLNGVYTNNGVFTSNGGTLTLDAGYTDILSFVAGRDISGNASAGTSNAAVNAVVVSGNYLYVGKAGSATACSQTPGSALGCELMVFDISSSTNPVYVAGRDTTGSDTGTGNLAIQALAVSGNYLYVGKAANATACSQTPGSALGCELMVFDISSSTNPTYIAGRDASGSNNGAVSQAVQSLSVYNNVLYVGKANSSTACSQTAGSATGCEIMVFTADSYNITYVAGRDVSGSSAGAGNVLVRSLVADDGYLYVGKNNNATACSQSAGSATGCEIMVFDISSTTNPTYAAGRDVSGSAAGTGSEIVYAVRPYGDTLYVTKAGNVTACSQTAGSALGCELQVYDISIPTSPTYVAGRDVSASADGTGSAITYSLAARDGFLYAGSAGNTTACSQIAGSALGCEVKAYDISSTTNPVFTYGRDASGSAAGTGSANVLSIAVTRKGLYVGKAGSATACSQTAGSAIGCELHFYPTNYSDRGYVNGTMVGASAFGNLTVDGEVTFLANASTSDFTIMSTATVTAPEALSVAGDYTNNGVFTAGSGTVYLSGSATQIATGTLSGVSAFHNIAFTNSGVKTLGANASTTNFIVESGSGEVIMPEAITVSGDYTNNSTTTHAGVTWTTRSSIEDNAWYSIAYGNGRFVALSTGGTNRVMYSDDGVTWATSSAAENNSWQDVTYGNGLFVAVANSGTNQVMTSPDGINWTSRAAAGSCLCRAITYGNGLFVAGGVSGSYGMYSYDGINWTSGNFINGSHYDVAYGNGVFVTVVYGTSGDQKVSYSYDGINWSTTTTPEGNNWNGITYGNGLFVAVGDAGTNRVMTSPDGITWTPRQEAAAIAWQDVTYGDGLFVAVAALTGSGNRVMTSPDGINWTSRVSAADINWRSVAYGEGKFVAVASTGSGNRVMTSDDTILWLTGTEVTATGTMTGASQLRDVRISGEVTFGANASTTNLLIATSSSSTTLPSAISIAGDYENNGTVHAGAGTVYLSGSNPQTLSGTMTATSSFNDLYIQNNSRIGTTTFDAVMTANSLTAQGSTYIAFKSGATTTIDTLTLSGSSTAPISLGATATGTESNFVLTSTASVSYTTISDSNACGSTGGAIDVSVGNNTDGGDTDCWDFLGTPAGSSSVALAESYTFYVGEATTTLGTITITDAETPSITSANDIRLTIATTTTDFRFDTSVTAPTFGGTASGKVSGTVSYADDGATLIIDVTSDFTASNTLTVAGLAVGSFSSVSTTTSQLELHTDGDSSGEPAALSSETFRITGALALADHDAGQADNQFSWQNRDDATVFAFKLAPTGETATMTDMVITLRGINDIDTSDISDFALYRDNNSDGSLDGSDTLLDGSGIMTINGQFGAITFSSDFLATTSYDYIVTGDTTSIVPGASVVFSLLTSGITATGETSNFQPVVTGSVSSIQHIRNVSGGGGSSSRVGGTPPPGNSIETGGEEGGGDPVGEEVDGENIAYDPDFKKPGNTGTPDNEWTNGSNALASDGVYATAASTNLRQSYYNFGFSIPTGNSIQGIAVKLDASGTTADGTIDVALSWDNGSSYTSAKATPTLAGSDIVYTVGGPADTWGRPWLPAEFNNGTFILRVTAQPASNTLRLDALEVRVYHQATGGGSGGGGRI